MIDMTIFTKLKEQLSKLPFLSKKGKILQEDSSGIDHNHNNEITDSPKFTDNDTTTGNGEITTNQSIRLRQHNLLLALLGGFIIAMLIVINVLQGKLKAKEVIDAKYDNAKPKLEVAAESIDPEKMWRNHFEDLLSENKRKFDERLKLAETNFSEI